MTTTQRSLVAAYDAALDLARQANDVAWVLPAGGERDGWGARVDHWTARAERIARAERASRRFESVLAGDRDELKQVAYRQALALAN